MQQIVAARVLTLILLVTVAGIAATTYLGTRGHAADRAAQAHVREAVAAAEAWYRDPLGGNGSYSALSAATLVHATRAVSPHVHVTVLAAGRAFCLDDEEGAGHSAYYVGGHVEQVANLARATPRRVTLVHSKFSDASAVCANAS